MSYKGKYRPTFPEKYAGDPTNIIYRSLWERKMMIYCDTNKNILEWKSEEICIPYFDPTTSKMRRYFPDFFIKVQESNGGIKKYLIEVKPEKQTSPPNKPKRQTKKYISEAMEFVKNQAKWKAAKEYCTDRLWEFKIITERELGIK
jgi:hypothetical protein